MKTRRDNLKSDIGNVVNRDYRSFVHLLFISFVHLLFIFNEFVTLPTGTEPSTERLSPMEACEWR